MCFTGGHPERSPIGHASRWNRTRAARRPRSTCSRPRGRPGVRRFMFAASSSAYGDTDELPKHEAMTPTPLSPYAAGKLAGEHYVSVYAQTMGLDGVSLRYFNVFGPRQDPSSPYSGVISQVHQRSWRRASGRRSTATACKPAISPTSPTWWRPTWPRCAVASRLRGQVLTWAPASASACSNWSTTLNRIFGTSLEPISRRPATGDVRDSLASLERIKEVLGYSPIVPFEEGLRKTVEATIRHA